MKLHIRQRYYAKSRFGEEPIKFKVRQPKGVGTDVFGEIWLDPVLRKPQNADLRSALIKHEMDEIKEWATGKRSSHTKARSREPLAIRNIGGVSGFWREIKRRERR